MILCASPRCRGRGHQPTCVDDGCRGCLPRPAADGRNLCELCTRWLAEDAIQAAFLYGELAERLAASNGAGEKTSGTRDRGTQLNGKAVQARTLIRHTLVSWCLLIAEERGISTPADEVKAMGDYVALHAVWLSAYTAAGDCSDELHTLAHGWPRRAAYPNPAKVVEIGPCPKAGCTGTITAIVRATDSLYPSAVECDAIGEDNLEPHIWPWGGDDFDGLTRDLRAAKVPA
ncbi:MAG TPA: hypothetical protein VF174_08940 [Micromonosporaceae bacterium]